MIIEERKRDKKLTATQIANYKKAGENVMSFIRSLPLEQQQDFFNKVFSLEDIVTVLTPQQLDDLVHLAEERKKEQAINKLASE